MQEKNINFGQIIKHIRVDRGVSRDYLAEKVGISPRYLQTIENKNQLPSFKVLSKLVHELNISLDNIIYPDRNITNDIQAKIIGKIYLCNENSLEIIDSLIDTLLKKQL